MESITLTFGTKGRVEFSVSSKQNNYKTLLPIVIEENGPQSYNVNIFGAEEHESVFPFFKATETSFFKFEHNDTRSSCFKIENGGRISSFLIEDKVYGLEILNERKQKLFEKHGGHNQKNLIVWFGVDEGEDDCGIYFTTRRSDSLDNQCTGRHGSQSHDIRPRTETDGISRVETDGPCRATVALNNTSTERYTEAYFQEPLIMNKRTFNFVFQKSKKMMDNLYLN
jgi:hypothetical protein